MAGGKKQRAAKERKEKQSASNSGSKDKSSSSNNKSSPNQGNTPPKHLSPPSGWDGNRDPTASHSRSGSNVSQGQQSTGSRATAQSGQRYQIREINKNLDMGYWMSSIASGYGVPEGYAKKPKQSNPTGRDISVRLNTFQVTSFPTKPVYQYDINVYTGEKEQQKRAAIKKIWGSKKANRERGPHWIFDGHKIAYSLQNWKQEKIITVDLDEEEGREPRKDADGNPKRDTHNIIIKPAGIVKFDALNAWLDGRADIDPPSIYEATNFLDHLMRQWPAEKYVTVKRSFFSPQQQRTDLGGGVEVFQGVYSSIRPVHIGPNSPAALSVNVDTSTTAFWRNVELTTILIHMLNADSIHHVNNMLKPRDGNQESRAFANLKRLRKVGITVTHRGEKEGGQKYIIDKFLMRNANQETFKVKDPKTGREEDISIADYFRSKYNVRIFNHELPVIRTTKGAVLPVEVCKISPDQRYPFKLSEKQTAQMIKIAVTPPDQRWKAVQHGLNMLDWDKNPYFVHYGLKINEKPTVVKAKLLPNPKVAFAGTAVNPGDFGKWDLRGKKFIQPLAASTMDAWGVCIIPGRGSAEREVVKRFIDNLINILLGHGCRVSEKSPVIIMGKPDPAESAAELYSTIGKKYQKNPKLMVFIVPDRDSENYSRIKRSCDCRFGCVSQVLQSVHVAKNQAQYCSNVAMKINAKCGGWTANAQGRQPNGWFKQPTMVIGADVSHGAPGSDAESIAALTVSMDKLMTKYAAAVENNGARVEMITKANIESMLTPLINEWAKSFRSYPAHVVYFRDGVSEGQYGALKNQEVAHLRELFHSLNPKGTKFTVIVASKRHHIRFFPEGDAGDKNKNAKPGTLVTTGATTPWEWDFYLCAHTAIKGTARPVHYHVLHDEQNLTPEEIQNWIYESSYQYVRSTTAVSLFPAVYYAHLAAHRANSHFDRRASDLQKEKRDARKGTRQPREPTASSSQVEEKPLITMPNDTGIRTTMWYV